MNHEKVEKNLGLMTILILIVVSFGALVEIVPLFFMEKNQQPLSEAHKPLNAIQLEGQDIYMREGCAVCHTQMIRPLRAEVERYGDYSKAEEYVYQHPFLWGSKRTGPDLHRVGDRYSCGWHIAHLIKPQNPVPESVMPAFKFLFTEKLDGKMTANKMKALRMVGVPYTDDQIAKAGETVKGITEGYALVLYLQSLGDAARETAKVNEMRMLEESGELKAGSADAYLEQLAKFSGFADIENCAAELGEKNEFTQIKEHVKKLYDL